MAAADPDLGDTLFTSAQLAKRVAELGRQISDDYEGREVLLVGVLKGAFVFMADLARVIDVRTQCDFMAVSSYGSSTKTSGVVRIVKDLDVDLTGRDVILVEDIVDSGLTLKYLRKNLTNRGPASLELCALLARDNADPETAPDVKYVGFRIQDEFVVGYGLDVAGRYRGLPFIAPYIGPDPYAGSDDA